jgi:hypothetical protein
VAELQGTYGIPRGTACLASWLKGSLRLALFHPPRVAKPRHDELYAIGRFEFDRCVALPLGRKRP